MTPTEKLRMWLHEPDTNTLEFDEVNGVAPGVTAAEWLDASTSHIRFWMIALLLLTDPRSIPAEDWPCFRGPRYDGISSETIDPSTWPESGPPVLWRQSVGLGMSGVVIGAGRLCTMGNQENVDTVYCLDAVTGESLWKHSYSSATDPNEFEGGPTSTPTIDRMSESVFTLSRGGDVFCFDLQSGKVRWQQNISDVANLRIPAWGFAGSPFVHENLVLLNVGDAGVAVEKQTGKLAWVSDDKDAGYSSMVPLQIAGHDAVAFGSARSYVCVDTKDGRLLWQQRWLTTFGCNASDPIVWNGHIFISSGYNRGSALLRMGEGEPETIWKSKDMQNQLSSSVLVDGYIYGIHGDVDAGAALRCILPADGSVKWTSSDIKFGALSATKKHLIALSDDGVLVIVKATPDEFEVVARQRVLDGKCWVAPVLANERIYTRDASGDLACVDVGGQAGH